MPHVLTVFDGLEQIMQRVESFEATARPLDRFPMSDIQQQLEVKTGTQVCIFREEGTIPEKTTYQVSVDAGYFRRPLLDNNGNPMKNHNGLPMPNEFFNQEELSTMLTFVTRTGGVLNLLDNQKQVGIELPYTRVEVVKNTIPEENTVTELVPRFKLGPFQIGKKLVTYTVIEEKIEENPIEVQDTALIKIEAKRGIFIVDRSHYHVRKVKDTLEFIGEKVFNYSNNS